MCVLCWKRIRNSREKKFIIYAIEQTLKRKIKQISLVSMHICLGLSCVFGVDKPGSDFPT